MPAPGRVRRPFAAPLLALLAVGLGAAGVGAVCGDHHRDVGEDCDREVLGAYTCERLCYDGGALACRADCTFDTTGCYACGDGAVQAAGTEVCDGPNLNGDQCGTQGPESGGGVLRCAPDCKSFDRTACLVCGNNLKDGTREVCDGTDLGGQTCASVGYGGDAQHTLHCAADCTQLLTSDCFVCGNGRIDPGEDCDAGPANGSGYCDATCHTLCGNTVLDPGEQCDDGNRLDFDGCSAQCLTEALIGGGTAGDTAATPPIDLCWAAWRILGVPSSPSVTCPDNTACDHNPAAGTCTFQYTACFNKTQVGPNTCSPTPVSRGLTSVTATDAGFLTAARTLLGGTIAGTTLTLPNVTTRNLCLTTTLAVAVGTPRTLTVDTRDAVVTDHDVLTFTCQ